MLSQSRFRTSFASLLLAVALVGCGTTPQAKEAKSLKRGEALLEKKDFARALLEFKNASQAMPNDAGPYYQMGLAYLGLSNLPTAAAAFRRATELDPKNDRAQLKLAEILTISRQRGLVEDASKLLETVLANSPGNTEANDTLAVAEWELGHTEEAAARIEDTLQKFPANLKASMALAQMKRSQKDFAGAEEVLKKAVASAPQSAEAALALGQMYWLAKQPDRAETEFKRSLQLDPKNGPALAGLAAIQTAAHRMDEAEQTYQRLAALPAKQYRHLYALFLFETGKREAALAELVKLSKEDPDNRAARSRLLAAYASMGKLTEAGQLLDHALGKNPQDTDALLERAELYLRAGNWQKAESDVNQILHLKADSAQAHFVLARIYRAEGSAKAEGQQLSEAIRLNPSMLPARLALAKNLLASHEAASALEVLNQTPLPQRMVLGVLVERNWALFATGNLQEMRRVLDRLLSAGRHPDLLIQDAVLKMREGDYTGARTAADEVLGHNSEDVRAARVLMESYLAQKQPLKATGRLTELVQGHPKSAQLQYLLGQAYLASGNMPQARQAFELAAAIPNFIQADLSLARLDLDENRMDEARRHLATVLSLEPQNIPALLMQADVESRAGNREGAIARYRAILETDGTNIFALNNLAWRLALDQPDEALRYAQQAGEIAPDDAAVEDTLGWVYYRKGIYRTAVDYLKRAVAKEPTARRQFHLGMSYMKVGDRDLGQKTLSAALQKDPTLLKTEQGW